MSSLQLESKYSTTQPYHVYSNLSMMNNDTSAKHTSVPLKFTENRQDAIIMYPSNYFCSLIKFELRSVNLPAFIPYIEIGQADVNKTIYKISITVGATEYEQQIEFTPEYLNAIQPAQPLLSQDINSHYYYCSTISKFLEDVNTAFNLLKTQHSLTGEGVKIILNEETKLFELYIDEVTALTPDLKIAMNEPLYNLFCEYPSKLRIDGKRELILPFNTISGSVVINNLSKVTINNVVYVKVVASNSTLSLWNPINGLIFTASYLNVVETAVSKTKLYNSSSILDQGSNVLESILTDFTIPFSEFTIYRNSIVYTPTGEYFFNDLKNNVAVSQININCFWEDRFGNLHIINSQSGMGGSIKLMFRRKDFYNINLNI